MKFCYECDGMDGLILIDEQYLDKIDDEILRELDIFIDCYGKSELVSTENPISLIPIRHRKNKSKTKCNEKAQNERKTLHFEILKTVRIYKNFDLK